MENKEGTEVVITPNEAMLVANLIQGCKVDHLQADAIEIVSLLKSTYDKMQAVIRLSQPLASAAKPKKEETVEEPVLDV